MPDLGSNEEGLDEDTEALLQADYQIGHFIRERIVPHAVLYFTGEAVDDDVSIWKVASVINNW